MNQPAHRVNLVSAPNDRDETVLHTLATDARCVVKHLALSGGREARTRLLALLSCGCVGAACPVGRLRRPYALRLG